MKKPSVSIRIKLFAQVGAILILAIFAFLALNYWYLGDVYIENEKKSMIDIAERISDFDVSREDFSSIINQYENDGRILINVYDKNGEFEYKSSLVFTNYSGRIEIVEKQENNDGSHFEIQQSKKNNTQYIVYYKPLDNGGEIEMFSRKDIIDKNVKVALNTMGVTAVIAVVVALLIIFIYSGRFTRPLIKMSEITNRMAKLDFSQKVKTKQNDEIGKLGGSINNLSDSLNDALVDLNEKNKRLLDEVEQEKKLDRIRKSFISNVSHELKTPISIIQGYAEGLKLMNEGDGSSSAEYCDIIMHETEKMNELVLQLLELSSLESGGNQLNTEPFVLSEFVNNYFKGIKIVLDEKQIKHETDVNPDFVGQGDKIKLNMVLNNYVSNAISHIDGERLIKVSAEDMGETYRVYVFNTGEHIRNEDIDNIWQSFYRADKSRSRSQGRFGLGLSIVSAICNLHETEYGVENVENGVRFYFDIKKAD
ncbi:MAG: HAMP domain-containing histidine kinase [Clostridiales bacterium]|nr:HAMP domain-containing histidine kinase [Clostridiales bacterium]